MREYRLRAYDHFLERPMPDWGPSLAEIDFDAYTYYANPMREGETKKKLGRPSRPTSRTPSSKLGIPKAEREYFGGVGAQYDSGTVYHKIREDLSKKGVIFTDTDTAVQEHPEIVRKYFGKIVPYNDNKFSALNSAVWSGGSFVYVPPGVDAGIPLQAYFRINAKNVGQFERTLIIADKGAKVHYIEGCLPLGEEVLDGDELTPIEGIESGQTVLNSDGAETTVEKTMVRPFDGRAHRHHPRLGRKRLPADPRAPGALRPAAARSPIGHADRPAAFGRGSEEAPVDRPRSSSPPGSSQPGDFIHYPINRTERDDPTLGAAAAHRPRVLPLRGVRPDDQRLRGRDVHLPHRRERVRRAELASRHPGAHREDALEDPRSPKKHAITVGVYSKPLYEFCLQHAGKYAEQKRLSKAVMDLPPAKQKVLLDDLLQRRRQHLRAVRHRPPRHDQSRASSPSRSRSSRPARGSSPRSTSGSRSTRR